MEKQKSFSIKPIRFLAFSFTISFSIIFLIFFSTWVFKTTPSQTHNLDFTNISLNSSDIVPKDSILLGTHLRKAENSSQIDEFPSFAGPQVRKSKTTNVTVTDAEKKDGLFLTGNSSLTRITVNSINVSSSRSSKSALGYSEGIGRRDIEDSHARPNISIRNRIDEKNEEKCDITKGRWVWDESYPLYTNVTCPFIDEGFSCQTNGRLDKDYMKWRWQPQDCDIPRFNATKMLELIRGKRLVFVGDSINRNQWESMLCLLMGGVKDPKKVYEVRGRKITKERGNYCFKFEDYKCTVEFYVSHYLVHESKAKIGRKKRTQTLRIDTMDKGSSRWKGADILVFNTAHWWSHSKTKAGINYYQEGDKVHPRLDVTKAFERALSTWASWIDNYINPHKTRIFFRSSSPAHFSGGKWNTGGHCKEAFRPVNETFTSNYPEKNMIVEEIIGRMKNNVTFLNVTRLSDYRPDAHPSKYGRKSVSPGVQDCSHWCLPGVPDNWNELLFYYLQLRTKGNFVN
ncbi:hypothetical protein CASFOL_009078 [Castilleja foliolosa]|uniref:Trichome birefringence-like N-terminal domain-containing protein n=1 Tax=Castilleja foliolosa TaxID=1961234 RepID=A0ABD3E0T6_9LAMI